MARACPFRDEEALNSDPRFTRSVISRQRAHRASSPASSRKRQRRSWRSIQKRPLRFSTSGLAASQTTVSAPSSGRRPRIFE